jgi:hypothetical protein
MSSSIDVLNFPIKSLISLSLFALAHTSAFGPAVAIAMIRLHCIDVLGPIILNGPIVSVVSDRSPTCRHFIVSWMLGVGSIRSNLYPSTVCTWFTFCDIQHTPVILVSGLGRINIHDQVAEGPELSALQWFGEVVCQHFLGGAVLNLDLSIGHTVRNEEVSDVDVAGPFAA